MALSLFFSLAHFSIRDFSGVDFERIMRRRGRERLLDRFYKVEEDLVTVTAALRQCFNVLFVLTVAYMLLSPAGAFEQWWRYVAIFGIATGAIAVFSLGIPAACAHYAGARILSVLLPVLLGIRVAMMPLVWLLRLIDEVVRRLAGVAEPEDPGEELEDELMSVVTEGAREGTLDADERQMIEGVIEFRSTDAGEIMTPRTELIGIEVGDPLGTVRQMFGKGSHSRLPVYEGTLDNIVGVLYAKDLLAFVGAEDARDVQTRKLMRKPVFVPSQIPLTDLLDTFQAQHTHVAVVLDEYGGTAGIVTIEDVLEEIVGDIRDEREPRGRAAGEGIKVLSPKVVEANGRERIDDVNDALAVSLPEDEEYDTIGGFVFSHLGHIPTKGEQFQTGEVKVTVLDAGPRRIRRVRIERIEANGNGRES
jgi:CBS domain containing-hemolysin-like protein